MQKICFICLVFLIWFLYGEVLTNRGVDNFNLHKVDQEIIKQNLINKKLAVRNSQMQLRILGLKGSLDLLEARSRMELSLIKKNEILVLLPDRWQKSEDSGSDVSLLEDSAPDISRADASVSNKQVAN